MLGGVVHIDRGAFGYVDLQPETVRGGALPADVEEDRLWRANGQDIQGEMTALRTAVPDDSTDQLRSGG